MVEFCLRPLQTIIHYVYIINKFLCENRFLRFLIAGGVNSLFGFMMYSLSILFGAPVWLSLVIGTVAGIMFNFCTVGGYVFRNLSLSKFPSFMISYAVCFAINLQLIELLSIYLGGPIVSQSLLTPPMAILSYILLRYFVWGKSR